ncbi:NUDIX hydrolase [Streptomyces chiangmaiensis]|uniref:NUDIX domain-containing protein n=1 Tax=Streptomyces chiangmaiensis TaxID=766497 RepID=A0ABU7FVL8_9ACTN|nr:NUDIX domain-containing protein [Streptomyces chiangmaiensis]MED7827843.1 NUDIX domain-containing protein [Streptomyces chiangmaiensis]
MPTDSPRHSVSVAGIVIREDGKILAIRRADNGAWEPPGGILELHEDPQTGVVREVFEETSITVDVHQLTGVYENMKLSVVAPVFRCEPVAGTERTSSESTDIDWLTPDEVRERMSEVIAIRVLDALDDSGPHVRSQDGRHLIPVRSR